MTSKNAFNGYERGIITMLISRFSLDGFEPQNQTLHKSYSTEELFPDCEYGVYAYVQGVENKMFLNHLPKEKQDKLSLWIGEIDNDATVFVCGIPKNKKWYDLKKTTFGEIKSKETKPNELFIPAESCLKIKNVRKIYDFRWVSDYARTMCEYDLG